MDHLRALIFRLLLLSSVVILCFMSARPVFSQALGGSTSSRYDEKPATFGGIGYLGQAPAFSYDGLPSGQAVCARVAQFSGVGDDGSDNTCRGLADRSYSNPAGTNYIGYAERYSAAWGSRIDIAQIFVVNRAFCPTGYTVYTSTGQALSQAVCRKQKPCAEVGTFTCTVKTVAGGTAIPTRTVRSACAMSVNVTGCVNRVTRSGSSYSEASFCAVVETPVGGPITDLPTINCATETAADQDPCALPGSSCGDGAPATCPPGFTKVGAVCQPNPFGADGCPGGTQQDPVTKQCVADTNYTACASGYHRNATSTGGFGVCVKDTDGSGGGGGGGTGGGTGAATGAGPNDVKCGATGDLCQTKFQEYLDTFKEFFGADPAAKIRGDALRSTAPTAEASENPLNKGPKHEAVSSLNTSGFISHSCPSPVQIQLLNRNVSLPFDKLCEFAGVISGLMIGFASLNAARIVVGAAV